MHNATLLIFYLKRKKNEYILFLLYNATLFLMQKSEKYFFFI